MSLQPSDSKMTFDEWKAKAIEMFGEDPKKWRFKCPSCGHVQTMADFAELNKLGITKDLDPNYAYYNCIGRYDSRAKEVGTILSGKQPCNYTGGGLFQLNPVEVTGPDGRIIKVFAFAEVKP